MLRDLASPKPTENVGPFRSRLYLFSDGKLAKAHGKGPGGESASALLSTQQPERNMNERLGRGSLQPWSWDNVPCSMELDVAQCRALAWGTGGWVPSTENKMKHRLSCRYTPQLQPLRLLT